MGCTSCRKSGECGNSHNSLGRYRRQATTLYNTTSDVAQKEEIMSLIVSIDELITNIKLQCPSQEELNLINEYLNSEYLKRIR